MSSILVIEESRKWLNHVKKALVPPHDLSCWSYEKDIGTLLKEKEYEIILLSLQLEKLDSFGLLKRVKLLSPYTSVVAISEIDEADLIVKAVKEPKIRHSHRLIHSFCLFLSKKTFSDLRSRLF